MKIKHFAADEVVASNGYIFKKGAVRTEGKRLVRLTGFVTDEQGNKYASWQYILRKTFKPSGKSTSFCTKIN